jgi:hypothetical protein
MTWFFHFTLRTIIELFDPTMLQIYSNSLLVAGFDHRGVLWW